MNTEVHTNAVTHIAVTCNMSLYAARTLQYFICGELPAGYSPAARATLLDLAKKLQEAIDNVGKA